MPIVAYLLSDAHHLLLNLTSGLDLSAKIIFIHFRGNTWRNAGQDSR
jgi:hypothetical protein